MSGLEGGTTETKEGVSEDCKGNEREEERTYCNEQGEV